MTYRLPRLAVCSALLAAPLVLTSCSDGGGDAGKAKSEFAALENTLQGSGKAGADLLAQGLADSAKAAAAAALPTGTEVKLDLATLRVDGDFAQVNADLTGKVSGRWQLLLIHQSAGWRLLESRRIK